MKQQQQQQQQQQHWKNLQRLSHLSSKDTAPSTTAAGLSRDPSTPLDSGRCEFINVTSSEAPNSRKAR